MLQAAPHGHVNSPTQAFYASRTDCAQDAGIPVCNAESSPIASQRCFALASRACVTASRRRHSSCTLQPLMGVLKARKLLGDNHALHAAALRRVTQLPRLMQHMHHALLQMDAAFFGRTLAFLSAIPSLLVLMKWPCLLPPE